MALITFAAAACSSLSPTPAPEELIVPAPSASPTKLLTEPAAEPTTKPPPSPTPQPTVRPTGSPAGAALTATIDQIDAGKFNREELAQTAFDYTTALAVGLGPRESGTGQEKAAADFLANEFAGMGYQVEIQPFTVKTLSSADSSFTLEQPGSAGALANPDDIHVNLLSGTADGEASGILTHVGLAMSSDVPDNGLEGQIALIQRGTISFRHKVNRAGQAGAVAAVIYNDVEGNFQGTLGRSNSESVSIPVVSISNEDGVKILESLSQGEVSATVSVVRKELSSRNVIAEKPGPGDDVVVLGAHYDSVPSLPGANDNAAGTAVLLTVAKSLAGQDLPFTVRFIPFGSEELGLRGSRAYLDSLTEEEASRIVAMLNFDALATGSAIRLLGTSRLTSLGIDLGHSLKITVTRSAGRVGSSSDHATFDRAGIPVLMFTAPDFSKIHTPEDTMEFVQADLLGDSARLALAVLEAPEFPVVLD